MHPAGFDEALARVLVDVQSGRWMGMADLLADTGDDRQARCTRSALLGKIAAGSNAVDEWLRERPGDRDALMMATRVAVERAGRAVEAGSREAEPLLQRAESLCRHGCDVDPSDPVPYLGLLALASSRGDRVPGLPSCPVPGPWNPFKQLWRVDPANREAGHRMLTAVGSGPTPHPADAQLFAHFTATSLGIAAGSPLQLLPLYALLGVFEHQRSRSSELAHLLWVSDAARADIERGWGWFLASDPAQRVVIDLSHLAHALAASAQYERAAAVFAALGPHGSPRPWGTVAASGDATEEFVRTRARALAVAGRAQGP